MTDAIKLRKELVFLQEDSLEAFRASLSPKMDAASWTYATNEIRIAREKVAMAIAILEGSDLCYPHGDSSSASPGGTSGTAGTSVQGTDSSYTFRPEDVGKEIVIRFGPVTDQGAEDGRRPSGTPEGSAERSDRLQSAAESGSVRWWPTPFRQAREFWWFAKDAWRFYE